MREPLVDPAVLDRLARDIGRKAAQEFAERYRTAVVERLAALRTAVAERHLDQAHNLLINIDGASRMLGARRLALAAGRLADRLREDHPPTPEDLSELSRLVSLTDAELARVLGGREGGSS